MSFLIYSGCRGQDFHAPCSGFFVIGNLRNTFVIENLVCKMKRRHHGDFEDERK